MSFSSNLWLCYCNIKHIAWSIRWKYTSIYCLIKGYTVALIENGDILKNQILNGYILAELSEDPEVLGSANCRGRVYEDILHGVSVSVKSAVEDLWHKLAHIGKVQVREQHEYVGILVCEVEEVCRWADVDYI